jgi:hypothetical protein
LVYLTAVPRVNKKYDMHPGWHDCGDPDEPGVTQIVRRSTGRASPSPASA